MPSNNKSSARAVLDSWTRALTLTARIEENPQRLLADVIQELADKSGEATALISGETCFSFQSIIQKVNRYSRWALEQGIRKGDVVCLLMHNQADYIAIWLGTTRVGAVVALINDQLVGEALAHCIEIVTPRHMIVSATLYQVAIDAQRLVGSQFKLWVHGGSAVGYPRIDFEVERYSGECLAATERRSIGLSDRALWIYTSGTTGRPKGTVHFVEELLIVPDSFGKYGWRVTGNDVIGGSAPLAFGAGYSSYASIPFRFGAAASLIPKFEPEKMFDTIQKHHISILTLAPTAYRKMLQVPDAEKKYDLSSLRVCTGGGESLTAPTYHAWKETFGLEIFEGLGTTEMMYVFASNVVSRKAKPGSFGQAVPGYELKVIDEEDKDAKAGTIGQFVACGPTGTIYWRDPDKQRHAITADGWNRAGDFVHADEDGYFWFVSRQDDIIKSSGYRIGPEEIEVTLATHPAVADVAVIGVPDEVRGQIAKAFVVLKPGQSVGSEEMIAFCKGKVATYKLPREVVIVNELPRTPTGKLLRRVLRQKEPVTQ